MTLSERVRQARKFLAAVEGKPITQEELARRCGWINGQTRISNYETGERGPRADSVMALARATGVRVEWLQYEKGYMHDDHAAIALAITEPEPGTGTDPDAEALSASPPLRQLILRLIALERDGALNEPAIQGLIQLLDALTQPKTKT